MKYSEAEVTVEPAVTVNVKYSGTEVTVEPAVTVNVKYCGTEVTVEPAVAVSQCEILWDRGDCKTSCSCQSA